MAGKLLFNFPHWVSVGFSDFYSWESDTVTSVLLNCDKRISVIQHQCINKWIIHLIHIYIVYTYKLMTNQYSFIGIERFGDMKFCFETRFIYLQLRFRVIILHIVQKDGMGSINVYVYRTLYSEKLLFCTGSKYTMYPLLGVAAHSNYTSHLVKDALTDTCRLVGVNKARGLQWYYHVYSASFY